MAQWLAVKLVGSMAEKWTDGMAGLTAVCWADEMDVTWDGLRAGWTTVKMVGSRAGCWVDGMAVTRADSGAG